MMSSAKATCEAIAQRATAQASHDFVKREKKSKNGFAFDFESCFGFITTLRVNYCTGLHWKLCGFEDHVPQRGVTSLCRDASGLVPG